MSNRCVILTVSLACVALCGETSRAASDVPQRSPGGQTLDIPKEHQTQGEVYYALPGVGTQFTWEADAPLLRQAATCNRVVGYLVAPFEFEKGRPPLLGGALRIPVASLVTGSEQGDATLHSPGVLDRTNHPELLITFQSAGPASDVTTKDNREQCRFDLVGELTVKGKKIRFASPARMALMPFANATQPFSPSDLVTLRTKFDLPLAEVGIDTAGGLGPDFAGTRVAIELYIMGTTVHPEKNLDPRISDALYVKQLAFMTELRDLRNPVDAYVLGHALIKESWDDSQMLNNIASSVLSDPDIKRRDLTFVEKAARRANELTDHKDPLCLITLAGLCYERSDLVGAVKWARQAVDNLEGQPFFIPPQIRATLQQYESEAKTPPSDKESKPED